MNHYPKTRGKFVIANVHEDMIAVCNAIDEGEDGAEFYMMLDEQASEDPILAPFLEMIKRSGYKLYPGVSADGKDIQLLY